MLFYPPATNTTTDTNTTPPPPPQIPTYGQLPLTHALLRSNLSSPSPKSVIPLLTQQLQWRVQDFHNRAVDTGRVESLKVFVVGRVVVRRAEGHSFPVYGGWEIYREATEGKVGGLGVGEGM